MTFFVCEEILQKTKLSMSEISSCDKFFQELQVSVNMSYWTLPVVFIEAPYILHFQILTHHFSPQRSYDFISSFSQSLNLKTEVTDFFFSPPCHPETDSIVASNSLTEFTCYFVPFLLCYFIISCLG